MSLIVISGRAEGAAIPAFDFVAQRLDVLGGFTDVLALILASGLERVEGGTAGAYGTHPSFRSRGRVSARVRILDIIAPSRAKLLRPALCVLRGHEVRNVTEGPTKRGEASPARQLRRSRILPCPEIGRHGGKSLGHLDSTA
jgi:hypothetical protein